MRRIKTLIITAVVLAMLGASPEAEAKKKGYRLVAGTQSRAETETERMAKGSFMVASHCLDCNNGYQIGQIAFSGYDKPRNSSVETFFITNNTDRTMSGVTMYVEYLMPDGRQLHKRFVRLVCVIPPGETRMAELQSWDKQKSFYFEGGEAPRRGGTPYKVVFDPISYYFRF